MASTPGSIAESNRRGWEGLAGGQMIERESANGRENRGHRRFYVYCRGGDPDAPAVAADAGAEYGTRWDYKPYGSVYMLDIGIADVKWPIYLQVVERLAPTFAFIPDYTASNIRAVRRCYRDLRRLGVERIGITPKYPGALTELWGVFGLDVTYCISIPSSYGGYVPAFEWVAGADYHLLGGGIAKQIKIAREIRAYGGVVSSADGNFAAAAARLRGKNARGKDAAAIFRDTVAILRDTVSRWRGW